MNDFYQKLIEAKGGTIAKTERRDTRNRFGELGWVGSCTTFFLNGVTWEYRTGFVYPKRNHGVPYNKVISYEQPNGEFKTVEATEFFSSLI